MPPPPAPGKAFIPTKRLLLAKAKAMLQRPQQSLFTAEAFNTTTIQKRNTAWRRDELRQLDKPDRGARSTAFPSTAAPALPPCQGPAQSPISESQPAATLAPPRAGNLSGSSNPRPRSAWLPSAWQPESQRQRSRTPASVPNRCCASSAPWQGWMMPSRKLPMPSPRFRPLNCSREESDQRLEGKPGEKKRVDTTAGKAGRGHFCNSLSPAE